ncbi:hypothetical protein VNI00_008111 [Paramarasmius palmivorus]|uniref:Uncharacterized protein n=1 Tax=Paramarasmius palmivorus TaxID=297713 RepID=A0AAW0CZ48_9AGAR
MSAPRKVVELGRVLYPHLRLCNHLPQHAISGGSRGHLARAIFTHGLQHVQPASTASQLSQKPFAIMRNFSNSPRIHNRKELEPGLNSKSESEPKLEMSLLLWEEIPMDVGREEERSRWKWKKILGASAFLVASGIGLKLYTLHKSENPDLEKQRILMNKAYAYFGGGLVLSAIMAWSMLAFRPLAKVTKRYPLLVMGVGLLNGIGLKLITSDSESTTKKHLKWMALSISPATLIASLYVLDPAFAFRAILVALIDLGGYCYTNTMANTYRPVPESWVGFISFLVASFVGPVFLPPGLRSVSWAEMLLLGFVGGGLSATAVFSGYRIIETDPERHPIDVAIGIWYQVAE